MNNNKQLNKFDIIVLFILAMIFVMVSPLFNEKTIQVTKEVKPKANNVVASDVAKTNNPTEKSVSKSFSLTEGKRILNKNGEQYTDEEVTAIMNLIDNWARINAKIILETANRS